MRHNREEVIARTVREYEALERLVAGLTEAQWALPVPRPETKDPWTVKDVLAHITHWKADVARKARGERPPAEERGLTEEVLAALREAPEAWFGGRERRAEWPYDVDGHLADHRVKDIERALADQP